MSSNKFLNFWKKLGPGLITGSSDDDPSGIATYSQAGAGFGFSTLWTALLTFPLMAAVQEMCARLGLVTAEGLTGTLKKYYPRYVLLLMLLFSFPAIVLNIGADIAGMGAVGNLIFPRIPASFFSVTFTVCLLIAIIYLPYRKIANTLKYLCMGLLVYLVVPFMIKQNWSEVLKHTFIPTVQWNKGYLSIIVGILGTTISPYLFFWQTNMEVEEVKSAGHTVMVDKRLIGETRRDVNFGMFFSNLVMYFIILTSGSVLFKNGIHEIQTVEDAAKALQPLTGNFTYYLFAIGIIGTGLLAIPVLSGSLSYVFCETFGWEEGLDKKFHEARPFYIIIATSLILGLLLNYIGVKPIQALIYAAILYGLTAPVLIAIILHVCNNRKIMGEFVNRKRSNILGIITLVLMTFAGVALMYFQFFT
ncbi:MAG: iron transporter [Bacteroidetes bacterium]|nr:MAG: iron transporter [Bacteroidota bacterium]